MFRLVSSDVDYLPNSAVASALALFWRWIMQVVRFGSDCPLTLARAVEDAATPDSYSHLGELERARRIAEMACGMTGKLMDKLHTKGIVSSQDVLDILGYGYEEYTD